MNLVIGIVRAALNILRSRSGRLMYVLRRAALGSLLVALSLASAPVRAQSEQLRESWQRVADLFAAAGVHSGATIADIGAGEGFLTVRLSPAVGATGKVYAVDIDAKVVAGLRRRVAASGMTNVEILAGAKDDPRLPHDSLDGALIVNAYHEMTSGHAMLTSLFRALRPDAHLVLCEPIPRAKGQSRRAQMKDHVLDPELIVQDLQAAGFRVLDRQDPFATNLGGTRFGLIVAARPAAGERPPKPERSE